MLGVPIFYAVHVKAVMRRQACPMYIHNLGDPYEALVKIKRYANVMA